MIYHAWYGAGPGTDEHFKLITDMPEDAINKQLYELAYQHADGFGGMHGIGVESDDFDSDEEYEEAQHEEIENILDYGFEPWNEEEHAGQCTYGVDSEPTTEKW